MNYETPSDHVCRDWRHIDNFVLLGSFIGVAILEVLHGHGADTFVDTGRFQVTWIYMLISSVVGSLAIVFAILARAIYLWQVKHGNRG